MAADAVRAKSLFLAAADLPADERAAFLDRECGGEAVLRARVEALLRADAPAVTGEYDDPVATDDSPDRDEQPGTVLAGKYKLLERIGEGGMGSVWMAEQTEPVKRKVAVKLIRSGLDSRAVLARFEAERQALAVMDHPNIARVLDGGQAPDGRPFFVMELVKGVPVTDFCDQRRLTPRQRLELFVPVCQAIQHAHQKGVIHRDVKPSNVLVALYDDKPVPKVIDFGVAKAAGQTLTDKTLHTGFGAVVGTPEYMSPEQASFNNLDIDTRSDVYSLGVLLYELLTGTTPVDRKSLKQAAVLEVLRIVREVDAPRPSAKLSSSVTLPSLAACRGTEPAKLTKLVRGELDWIVLKALEKDRGRRYESANGFAADVSRYLAGEAVQAVPPSAGYRLRKWARKHRGPVAAAAVVLLALVTGVIGTTWQAVRAEREAARAREAEAVANKNGDEAAYNLGLRDGALKLAKERLEEANRSAEDANQARWEATIERIKSDIRAMSLQVDLDLAEFNIDSRNALLRLARPTKNPGNPIAAKAVATDADGNEQVIHGIHQFNDRARPEYLALREFIAAAVLTAGQNYAPLLPPVLHDGRTPSDRRLSPDGRTLLTHAEDGSARLWDVRTSRPLAILREADEWVARCGFSPDGRTVYTDDQTDTVRFWDAAAGTLRARSAPLPTPLPRAERVNRYTVIGNDRLLKAFELVGPAVPGDLGNPILSVSPVGLWDTDTGRLVARIDGPGRSAHQYNFSSDGRWVWTIEGRNTVLVFAATDGRLVARLEAGEGSISAVFDSPSGRRILALGRGDTGYFTRVWSADAWTAAPITFWGHHSRLDFLPDDRIAVSTAADGVYELTHLGGGGPVIRLASAGPPFVVKGPLLIDGAGKCFDLDTGRQRRPPAGRRFSPDVSKRAVDGRFAVLDGSGFADDNLQPKAVYHLATEKALAAGINVGGGIELPGFGLICANSYANSSVTVYVVPHGLDGIAPATLELWAQVAVRGELGPDGEFVKWDEPTWQRKWRELAAVPPPAPACPFPGHLARDPLHWLRKEFEAADADAQLPLARELHHRAIALGDPAEAARWQREIDRRTRETAPPPRPAR